MSDQQLENDHDILIRATERIYQVQAEIRDLEIDDDIIRQRLDDLEHLVRGWDIKLRLAMWLFGPIGSIVGAIITLALQWVFGAMQ